MPTQKVKFSMSVKELSFTFEGDLDTGQRIQSGINRTLTNLTKQSERLLPGFEDEDTTITVKAINPDATGNAKKGRPARKSRAKGTGPSSLMIRLRSDGYFNQRREAKTVQAELEKLGHKFAMNAVSNALLALVRKSVLTREENSEGNYEYLKGPNDDFGGDSEEPE